MRLFGRKNNIDTVPAEVRDYYRSERRERAGVAWMLSLGTLLFTLVLAGVLFYGGKWTYTHVIHPDKKEPTQQAATSTSDTETKNEAQQESDKKTGTSSTNTTTPSKSEDTTKKQDTSTTVTTGSASTPAGESDPSRLISTGPDE